MNLCDGIAGQEHRHLAWSIRRAGSPPAPQTGSLCSDARVFSDCGYTAHDSLVLLCGRLDDLHNKALLL